MLKKNFITLLVFFMVTPSLVYSMRLFRKKPALIFTDCADNFNFSCDGKQKAKKKKKKKPLLTAESQLDLRGDFDNEELRLVKLFISAVVKNKKLPRDPIPKNINVSCPTEIKKGTFIHCNALMASAIKGNYPACYQLVKIFGAKINKRNPDGKTALIFSAEHGHLKVVKFLVCEGANKDKSDKEDLTPLMYATYFGHKNIVKFLLKKGADPLLEASNGKTTVSFANFKNNKIEKDLKQHIVLESSTKKQLQALNNYTADIHPSAYNPFYQHDV